MLEGRAGGVDDRMSFDRDVDTDFCGVSRQDLEGDCEEVNGKDETSI